VRASRWLSANPDKAFAEKLYLLFLPVFVAMTSLLLLDLWARFVGPIA
jgi:hypothetical protein